MKKKLFTLLALLTTIVSGAWAQITTKTWDITSITDTEITALTTDVDADHKKTFKEGTGYICNVDAGTANNGDVTYVVRDASGNEIATTEGLIFGRSGDVIKKEAFRIYTGSGNKSIYFNYNKGIVRLPSIKAGQDVVVTTNAYDGTVSVTNTDTQTPNVSEGVFSFTVKETGTVDIQFSSKPFLKTIEVRNPATKHTVTYSLGSGTGTVPTQGDISEGGTFTVADAPGDLIPPTGKEFKCWNDGTTDYNPGDTYTMGSSNVTLTAQYQDEATKYTITYDLGDATGGTAPTQASLAAGKTFTVAAIPSDLVAPANKVFTGWLCNIDNILYAPGVTYTMTAAATTFTAQYSSYITVYDLKNGVGSTTKTADDATYTEGTSFSFSNTAGRIKITAATGQMFKSGDIIVFSGTVGNQSKYFGIKYGTTDALGTNLYKTDAPGDGFVQGTLTLSDDASSIYIGRYDGTTTTITSFMVCRLAKPMTMNAFEWTTFVSDKALDFEGSGVTAYVVTGHTGNALDKTEVTKVAANTPLLLNAAAGDYNIPVAASGTAYTDNKLKAGTGAAVAKEDGKTKYVLSLDANDKIAFMKINNDPATVPANKAYLEFDEVISAPSFSFGDATAIDYVRSKTEDVRGDFYNLNGQRVAQPTKGLYIVNGRKVIMK